LGQVQINGLFVKLAKVAEDIDRFVFSGIEECVAKEPGGHGTGKITMEATVSASLWGNNEEDRSWADICVYWSVPQWGLGHGEIGEEASWGS
jgi:hypothetical protein